MSVNAGNVTISESCPASTEPLNWTLDSPTVWHAALQSPGPPRGWLSPGCHNPSLHGC